jgi:short-subunit dehydrogenase
LSRAVAFAIEPNLAQAIIDAVTDSQSPPARADAGLVVVFGGRSEIGIEVAKRLAPGATVVLAARRADDLAEESAAVRASGAAAVAVREFDADVLESHGPLVDEIIAEYGPIDTAVLAFGVLGDQARAEKDPAHAAAILHTDFVAQASLLTVLSTAMQWAGGRRIVAFSSVAGVRVRRANYVYGSAKAGLDGFCNGLADALHGSGVRLLLVRPGFVIGRMTEGMDPAPFSSTPAQVADATVRALRKGRRVVWVPPVLRPVFAVMGLLPRFVWRRLPR